MPLAHFGTYKITENFYKLSGRTEGWEPVWNNLALVNFTPDYLNDKLSYQLFRIEEDVMFFNLNWDIDKKEVIPLKTIVEWLNKPIQAEVVFHDVENVIMYKVELINLMFIEVLEPFYYNWEDNTLKQLVVKFKYDSIKIIV